MSEESTSIYEKMCIDTIESNPNMLVPWYIMAAYSYYVEDNPLLTDGSFDRLATRLLENFDKVEHQHKEFIDKDALYAGSYLGEYPTRIEDVVKQMRREYGK